jgi:adenosylhomocysteinase
VSEVDEIKALEAFAVMSVREAAAIGEVFITATGGIDAIRGEHFERMKDGAIVANAGHYERELNLGELRAMSAETEEIRPHVTEYRLGDGRRIHVVAGGELVNIAAGEGHPVEIMDLSFAVQALSAHYLANHYRELKPGVYTLSEAIDRKIAKLKLDSVGATLDTLTEAQRAYLESWR